MLFAEFAAASDIVYCKNSSAVVVDCEDIQAKHIGFKQTIVLHY